jgi:hypothetical protein
MGEKYPKANKNNRDRKNSSDTLIYQTTTSRFYRNHTIECHDLELMRMNDSVISKSNPLVHLFKSFYNWVC